VRTVEEALAASRPGAAFSNSTEWEYWSPNWCGRCLRDAPFRNGISPVGCPLIVVAMCHQRTPSEWREQEGIHDYHCIEFRAPDGGGGEPRPRPEPSGMDGLFPRPKRQTRMLTGSPVREVVSS
jgi:hypothetical protein